MKTILKLAFFLAMIIGISSCNDDDMIVDTSHICTASVHNLVSDIQDVGSATLERREGEVSMTMTIGTLIPDHAYSMWWIVWNKSENCESPNNCKASPDLGNSANVEVELLIADGMVVGNDGIGTFSGSLKENDISGSANEIIGFLNFGGLQNAMDSEIHLVLKSHGPAISGESNEQTSTFFGGCTTNLPNFSEIPDEEGECGVIMAAIFPRDCQ